MEGNMNCRRGTVCKTPSFNDGNIRTCKAIWREEK